jgi:hypothetical protein
MKRPKSYSIDPKHLQNARALQRDRARTRTQTPVSEAAVLNSLEPYSLPVRRAGFLQPWSWEILEANGSECSTPTGFRPQAQGWRPAPTLGWGMAMPSTPMGLRRGLDLSTDVGRELLLKPPLDHPIGRWCSSG